MNRSEHLKRCKDRAIKLIEQGKIAEGMASFTSDMGKHPDTLATIQNGVFHEIIMAALMTNSQVDCINAIKGFN